MSKSLYLSEEAFGSLRSLQNWVIRDIPPVYWGYLPRVHRKDDLFAVYASGCSVTPKILNQNLAVVGIDFLAYESSPDSDKGEDSVNIYHFTISELKNPVSDLRYRMDGPYYREALLEHWPCSQDALDFYSSVGLPFDLPTSECFDTAEFE